MGERYMLILKDNNEAASQPGNSTNIMLLDTITHLPVMEGNCMKEYQHHIEEMMSMKFGNDNLRIIRSEG